MFKSPQVADLHRRSQELQSVLFQTVQHSSIPMMQTLEFAFPTCMWLQSIWLRTGLRADATQIVYSWDTLRYHCQRFTVANARAVIFAYPSQQNFNSLWDTKQSDHCAEILQFHVGEMLTSTSQNQNLWNDIPLRKILIFQQHLFQQIRLWPPHLSEFLLYYAAPGIRTRQTQH